MKLLLIEDDIELANSLVERFREQGYVTDHVSDGKTGLTEALRGDFRAIVVDRMLPGMDGLELVRALRREKSTPVIYLTTMGGIDDRVQGLEAGGDDYLVKPFAFAELVARIRALLRRAQPGLPPVLTHGDLKLDPGKRVAMRAGRLLDLSPKEFSVLELLLAARGRVVSTEELLERAWDEAADPFTNTVKVTISRLRRKLDEPPVIETVAHAGYKI